MNKDMVLYVPTRGRVDHQFTLRNLPKRWRERAISVCPQDEVKELSSQFPDLLDIVVPRLKNETCATKRAWIFRKTKHEKIMMLDDDLAFFHRKKGQPGLHNDEKLKAAMFDKIEAKLDTYRHGTIAPRFMHHTRSAGAWEYNAKCTQVLAYHVPTVLKHCKLNNVERFEDLEYCLQLLTKGFPNFKYQDGAYNEVRGYNAPGGCSIYRTKKKIDEACRRLADLYPDVVRVVKRDDIGEGGIKGSYRVVIRWKAALKQ